MSSVITSGNFSICESRYWVDAKREYTLLFNIIINDDVSNIRFVLTANYLLFYIVVTSQRGMLYGRGIDW